MDQARASSTSRFRSGNRDKLGRRRKVHRSLFRNRRITVAAAGIASLTLLAAGCSSSATSSTSAASTSSSSTAAIGPLPCKPGTLDGKTVLLSPYWLDNFNTANTYWQKKYLVACGASKVDIINPNAVASSQLTTIGTAVSSHSYDLIAWAPVDPSSAPTTIRQIQNAHILQLVNFASFPPGSLKGLSYAATWVDRTKQYIPAAQAAAKFVLKHPNLGKPTIAYVGDLPTSLQCKQTFQSLVAGVRDVYPDAKVVADIGATGQSDADTKMANFITRGIKFNIFAGCGGAVALGGISAINAAGLGKAIDKVPQHVYEMSPDGSPPELQQLWDENSSVMRVGLFGPKDAAFAGVQLMAGLLTGAIKPTANVAKEAYIKFLTPDCQQSRQIAIAQFQGVPGFTVPKCSFTYTGND